MTETKPTPNDAVVELMAEALWRSRSEHSGPEWCDLSADMQARGRMHIRAILSALSDAGLAVRPTMATPEMTKAAQDYDDGIHCADMTYWFRVWDAMEAAFHPSQLETKR